jgi:hypothetical protein
MISLFFDPSSFFNGSSSFTSAAFASSAGGVLSSAFCSVSVDCHRWESRGDSGLKLDGWIACLKNSNLVLDEGVDNDLESVEAVKTRLCLKTARRSMI